MRERKEWTCQRPAGLPTATLPTATTLKIQIQVFIILQFFMSYHTFFILHSQILVGADSVGSRLLVCFGLWSASVVWATPSLGSTSWTWIPWTRWRTSPTMTKPVKPGTLWLSKIRHRLTTDLQWFEKLYIYIYCFLIWFDVAIISTCIAISVQQ